MVNKRSGALRSPIGQFSMQALVLVLACMVPGSSEIIFSGDQDGFIEEGEYLATGSITVKAGKTLTFAPGCVVRFKQYAGLIVEGALICKGTPSKSIVFTSDYHRSSSAGKSKLASPFDWNGITVMDSSSSIDWEYVRVAYGISGLEVKSPATPIRIVQCVFSDNGRSAFTSGGKSPIDVKDYEPFNYEQRQPLRISTQPQPDTIHFPRVTPVAAPVAPKTPMSGKAKLRWCFVGIGGVGAALAAYSYFGQALPLNDKVRNAGDSNLNSLVKQRDSATDRANIGWIISAAAGAGFALTFFF